MIRIIILLLILPTISSCFKETRPDTTTWEVLEIKSGDTLMARNVDYPYQIKLACIKSMPVQESRKFLSANIATANNRVIVQQIGKTLSPQTSTPELILAEIFVDLGDGPQSLNEAQLLGGQARLDEKASPQNCPRIASMRKAQAEAQELKVGMWQ